MRRALFTFCVLIATLTAACAREDYPILYPKWDQAPAWAVKACGVHPVLCGDGGCCGQGFECTSDAGLPMYHYPGYCRWVGVF